MTYIDMSALSVNKKGSGVSFRIFASLDCSIFTIHIVARKSYHPCDWMTHQDEEGKSILSFSPDLEQGSETIGNVSKRW
jgi:hypothetical protein